MTSEWMADALMREWECQSLPRAKERADQTTSGDPSTTEAGAVPSAEEEVALETSIDGASPAS